MVFVCLFFFFFLFFFTFLLNLKPVSWLVAMMNKYSQFRLFFSFNQPPAPLPSHPITLHFQEFFPRGRSKFLWNIHLNMNEENAMARAEIKISLFTVPEFGNAISICAVWPRDIYCFGLSFLYCGVPFIPSCRQWCYHLLITSSSLRHSGQLHCFQGSNMWT